jgi:hypothetical protein
MCFSAALDAGIATGARVHQWFKSRFRVSYVTQIAKFVGRVQLESEIM